MVEDLAPHSRYLPRYTLPSRTLLKNDYLSSTTGFHSFRFTNSHQARNVSTDHTNHPRSTQRRICPLSPANHQNPQHAWKSSSRHLGLHSAHLCVYIPPNPIILHEHVPNAIRTTQNPPPSKRHPHNKPLSSDPHASLRHLRRHTRHAIPSMQPCPLRSSKLSHPSSIVCGELSRGC